MCFPFLAEKKGPAQFNCSAAKRPFMQDKRCDHDPNRAAALSDNIITGKGQIQVRLHAFSPKLGTLCTTSVKCRVSSDVIGRNHRVSVCGGKYSRHIRLLSLLTNLQHQFFEKYLNVAAIISERGGFQSDEMPYFSSSNCGKTPIVIHFFGLFPQGTFVRKYHKECVGCPNECGLLCARVSASKFCSPQAIREGMNIIGHNGCQQGRPVRANTSGESGMPNR